MDLLWLVGKKTARFGIRDGCFQMLFPVSVPAGSITLFGVHGKKRVELPMGPFPAGAHLVDLPKLAPGVYAMWIALGPFTGSAHLVHTGNRTTLMQRIQEDPARLHEGSGQVPRFGPPATR